MKRLVPVVVSVVVAAGLVEPSLAFNDGLTPLYSWYSAARADNFATSEGIWIGQIGFTKEGYTFAREEGLVFDPARPQPQGTVPLYAWYDNARGDNFITSDPNWAGRPGDTREGYGFSRIEGYIHDAPHPGTIPLVSWYNPEREDNFATTDPFWRAEVGAVQDGYTLYRVEGYLQPSYLTPFQPEVDFHGRMMAVTTSPADNNVVFVAAESGGVFRSLDGGATWAQVDALPVHRMNDLRFDPDDPSVLLATTGGDSAATFAGAIWLSEDGGETWRQPSGALPPAGQACASAWGIAFEPSSRRVFVGTDCGVAVSDDDGQSWRYDLIGAIASLVADGGVVDACGPAGHSRRGIDGQWRLSPGTTAQACNLGATHAIAASPFDRDVLFIANATAVWESDNAGQTWTDLKFPGDNSSRVPLVRVGPVGDIGQQFAVFAGRGFDVWSQVCPGSGLPRCATRTEAWTGVFINHVDPTDLVFRGSELACPLFATTDGGLHRSDDCGNTWAYAGGTRGQLSALQIYQVTGEVRPDHTNVYIGTQDNGGCVSLDGGGRWNCTLGGDVLFIQAKRHPIDGERPPVVYTIIDGNPPVNRFRPSDLAPPQEAWTNPDGEPPASNPWIIEDPAYVQYGLLNGVPMLFVTEHYGLDGWPRRISFPPGTVRDGAVPFIGGPLSDPTVYTSVLRPDQTTGLIVSHNVRSDGSVQTAADVGIGNVRGFCLGQGTFVCPKVFGANQFDGRRALVADTLPSPRMLITSNAGTWTPLPTLDRLITRNGTLRFEPTVIAFDPENSERILVGTESAGVMASLDGGATWSAVPGSEKATAISSFFFDHDQILVATYGRGLWRLDLTDFTPAEGEDIPGDCSNDGVVTINELLLGVNILLGSANLAACPAFDTDGNAAVTVSELIRAVNAALSGGGAGI